MADQHQVQQPEGKCLCANCLSHTLGLDVRLFHDVQAIIFAYSLVLAKKISQDWVIDSLDYAKKTADPIRTFGGLVRSRCDELGMTAYIQAVFVEPMPAGAYVVAPMQQATKPPETQPTAAKKVDLFTPSNN